MGIKARPAPPVRRESVSLPADMISHLMRLMSTDDPEEAVVAALKAYIHERQREALRNFSGSLEGSDYPPEWDTPEGTVEWVRSQRRGGAPFPPSV